MDEILADYNEAELELLAGFLQKARQNSESSRISANFFFKQTDCSIWERETPPPAKPGPPSKYPKEIRVPARSKV